MDGHGGASRGLLAWELCVEEHELTPAFEVAQDRGLCEPAGEQHGEHFWRLTEKGRAGVSSKDPPGEAGRST